MTERMEQDMEAIIPAERKNQRSMSIHSICDPLASSTSSLSDHDSEATLTYNDRTASMDELPKMDSLSPSEEQAVRALEDLRADTSMSPSQSQADFLNRVQNYAIVNSAVRVWDQGKNYNRALKWGGEMVESVVGGVVQRLEPLEPFAVRQLDRFENYKYSTPEKSPNESLPESTSPSASSRWQNVLISTGGLTASISEQSLQSLIFCLRCLRLATSHLGTSISTLQSLLQNAQHATDEENQSPNRRSIIGARIERIKQDIVDTLRKAIDVVSRHAGSALPEPARHTVKVYILSLPARWQAASNSNQSSPQSDMNGMTREEETGWKVLTLASESLEMLRGVMNVVGDTLQSAEEWAGRLGRNKRTSNAGLATPESTTNEEDINEKERLRQREMQVDA